MLTQMPLIDLHIMSENDELPNNVGFKIVGGRTIYKYIGWMWRQSDKQIYLNKHDLFADNEERYRRYLSDDTLIEIVPFQNLNNAPSFNYNAPYNAEFLGAQPARASQDY
jgi:hypothetical protein